MIFSSIKNLSENNFGQKYMTCAAVFGNPQSGRAASGQDRN